MDTIIAVPTMGTVRVELVGWLKEQPVPYFFTNHITPHANARNLIVEFFLKQKSDFKYLLMVDSDTAPPKHTIETLRKHIDEGAAAATGITPIMRGSKRSWNVYQSHKEVEQVIETIPNEPFEVVGCGASCLMIACKTFKRIKEPYFKAIEFDNGTRCSEDLYFCDQLFKKDLKIMCDPSVICQHYKEVPL